jgi:hypothetical protein
MESPGGGNPNCPEDGLSIQNHNNHPPMKTRNMLVNMPSFVTRVRMLTLLDQGGFASVGPSD